MSSNPAHLAAHHCFFSFTGEYDRALRNLISQDLHDTVFLFPILGEDLPLRNHLIMLLMARYGGLPSNWRLTDYNEGYLFKPPDWLLPNEPIVDSEFWESFHGLTMRSWRLTRSLPYRGPVQRETIVIRGFPIDLWHEEFFSRAVASMGSMVSIAPECLDGRTKCYATISIDCDHAGLIPTRLYVGHDGIRTRCTVQLVGRDIVTPLISGNLRPLLTRVFIIPKLLKRNLMTRTTRITLGGFPSSLTSVPQSLASLTWLEQVLRPLRWRKKVLPAA